MVTTGQIERIYKEIQPHFVRNGDVDGYVSLFTEDAVWWPLGRQTRIGPGEIAEGFRQVIEGTHTSPVFDALEIQVADAFSYAAMAGTITIVFDNGDPTQVVYSREVWVFREVAGEAKICRMTWNQNP